jgi:hypothetical protein
VTADDRAPLRYDRAMSQPIDPLQRRVHIGMEALAILLVVPTLWQISKTPRLTRTQRDSLRLIAFATLAVDGWLLWHWSQQRG